jgi:cell division septation protein DedD
MNLAQEYFLAGRYEEALVPLNELLGTKGRSTGRGEAAYWAGFCHLKLGDYRQATDRLRQALSDLKDPQRDGPGLVGLGDSLLGQGASREAEEQYAKALTAYSRYVDQELVRQKMVSTRGGATPTPSPAAPKPGADRPKSAAPRSRSEEGGAAAPAKGGPYSVQVGAFSDRDAAKKLLEQLRKLGHEGHIQYMQRQGQPLYCVRVGRYATKQDAENAKQRLDSVGYPCFVVE